MPIAGITHPIDPLLRIQDIVGNPRKGKPALIPVTRQTWWQWEKEGLLPEPVQLTPSLKAWRASDITRFINEKIKVGSPQQAASMEVSK